MFFLIISFTFIATISKVYKIHSITSKIEALLHFRTNTVITFLW